MPFPPDSPPAATPPQTPQVLTYADFHCISVTDNAIILPPSPLPPREAFPQVCCNCLTPTLSRFHILYGVRVPMCARCGWTWSVIRIIAIAILSLPLWIIAGIATLTRSGVRDDGCSWAGLGIGIVISPLIYKLTGWFMVMPASVILNGTPSLLHIGFRNREFHRMAQAHFLEIFPHLART